MEQVKAEPVAWMYEREDGLTLCLLERIPADQLQAGTSEVPLYVTPQPAAVDGLVEVAEDLAREIADLFEEASNNPCTCNIDENSCRHCSAWGRAAHTTKERLTAALSAMSPAGEVEQIVAWLRRDADILESCVKMGLPTFSPTVSKHDAALKRETANAIEAGEHKP